jgi:hypothetical protein
MTPFAWLQGLVARRPACRPVHGAGAAAVANVAAQAIHSDLDASGAALELVIGGYLIAVAILLIFGARLGQTTASDRSWIAENPRHLR